MAAFSTFGTHLLTHTHKWFPELIRLYYDNCNIQGRAIVLKLSTQVLHHQVQHGYSTST